VGLLLPQMEASLRSSEAKRSSPAGSGKSNGRPSRSTLAKAVYPVSPAVR
jgi:hypothetical protein